MVSYGFFLALEGFLLVEEVDRETLQAESSRSKNKHLRLKEGRKKSRVEKGTVSSMELSCYHILL